MNPRPLVVLAAVICAAAAYTSPAQAAAVDVTVHTAAELQDAIAAYNADTSDDGYVVHLAAGTYSLTDEIVVTNNAGALSLLGSGARTTVLRATGGHRVMHLGDSNHHAEIDDVTITGGRAGANAGGGILSARPLDLRRDTISDNSAQNGGGIAGAAGGLGVFDSTFSDNSASVQDGALETGGGAIDNQSGLYIRNSTFSGNSVTGTVAHPALGGAIDSRPSSGDPEIYFSTFAGNSVTGPGADGRDLAAPAHHSNGTTVFYTYVNSNIYASEPVGGAPAGQPHNCAGGNLTGASGSHDLDSGSSCDGQPNMDAGLLALANNGGPTDTHALSAGSVAINVTGDCAIINGGPATTDQRGLARPFTVDGQCDSGAYELQSGNDLGVAISGAPDPVQAGSNVTFTITVAATGPSGDATQPTVTTAVPSGATLVSITPSQGACTGTTCSLGALGNGSSATVALVLRTGSPGTLSAGASVSGPRPETTGANNSAAASVAVVAAPVRTPTQTQSVAAISGLRFSPGRFRASKGSRVTFTLASPGKVTFKVQRKVCKKQHCTWKTSGKAFKRSAKAGANGFKFVRRSLRPGAYRLVATPAARGARALRAGFTIVR